MPTYTFENIPDYFRARPQWVCWKREERDGKSTKVPYQTNGEPASTTDPSTWTSMLFAAAAYIEKRCDGIGYVISADEQIVAVDLDHVINVVDELEPAAAEIVQALDSYTEISPSGEGVHVYAFGTKPGNRCKANVGKFAAEMYDGVRYLTFTGWHVEGTPTTVEHRGDQIAQLYARLFTEQPKPAKLRELHGTRKTPTLTDDEVIALCRKAKNAEKFAALFDRGEGDDASAADMALIGCFKFYTQDAEQIDRLMRRSKLARDKYDDRRGDGTYLNYSIERALQNVDEVYTTRATPTPAAAPVIAPVDDGELMTIGAVKALLGGHQEWVVHNMLGVGSFSELVSKPGVGKSVFAQHLAASVVLGKPFLGRAVKQGLVVYFAFERGGSVARNLERLGIAEDHPDMRLWVHGVDNTDPVAWLQMRLGERKPVLIILDVLQDLTRTKENNSYSEGTNALGPLLQYAQETRTHILALHHSGKDEKEGIDAPLGTVAHSGKPDTILNYRRLNRLDPKSPRVLSCAKHNLSPNGPEDVPEVVLQLGPEGLYIAGLRWQIQLREDGRKLLGAFQRTKGPQLEADLVAWAQIDAKRFKPTMVRLMSCGSVVRTGTGKRGSPYLYEPLGGNPDAALAVWALRGEAEQETSRMENPAA
jgi:putative DNA primase/helicase